MKRISDHSPISIKVAQLIGKRDLPYRISKEVSRHPMFARLSNRLIAAAELHLEPINKAVDLCKFFIQEAAIQTRQFILNNQPQEKMCRLSRLSSIAKAVWKGDAKLARTLISSTDLGGEHLEILLGRPFLKDAVAFEAVLADLKRSLSDGNRAAVLNSTQPVGSAKNSKKIALRKIDNLAQLWRVESPRLVLSSVSLTPELAREIGLDQNVDRTSGPKQMLNALAAGWAPTFSAKPFF